MIESPGTLTKYSQRKLHIVSSDVPYPPDYGGVIDVFYKLKALSELGIEIYLHCFQYGREESEVLNKYCKRVFYYPRKTGLKGVSLKYPYMMYSRRDKRLFQNLMAIEAPILLEGVHCVYYLNRPELKSRIILLRNQNVEAEYYNGLKSRTNNPFQKLYYLVESFLLRRIEQNLQRADAFLTVSSTDHDYFEKRYPQHRHLYIPSFSSEANHLNSPNVKRSYILYHGNLGHPENNEATIYILKEIVSLLPEYLFIFAGKSPRPSFLKMAEQFPNVSIVPNPGTNEMDELISNAQINLLLTFQATGLKLKLLEALKKGRFVIANNAMVHGSNLEEACILANDTTEIVRQIRLTMKLPFEQEEAGRRNGILNRLYNSRNNALKIAELAFSRS